MVATAAGGGEHGGVIELVAKGVLIGLGAAVPIGPVNVEMARRTLRGGFLAGAALGAGAVSVDVAYATLTSLSVGRFLDRPAVSVPLAVGSVLLLGYLGYSCLRAAWGVRTGPPIATTEWPAADGPVLNYQSVPPPPPPAPLPRPPAQPGKAYATGLVMTLVNPMTLAFWFTVLPSVAGPIPATQLLRVAFGVFVGTISWVLAFSGTLSVLGKFRRDVWMRVTDTAGGVTLIAFAAAAFLRCIWPLL